MELFQLVIAPAQELFPDGVVVEHALKNDRHIISIDRNSDVEIHDIDPKLSDYPKGMPKSTVDYKML